MTLLLSLSCQPAFADWFVSDRVKRLIERAESGDVEAAMRVASAYDSGVGAPRSGRDAMMWYLAAAKQGLAEAQNSVGSGLQAEQRFAEALPWYESAAAQGHPSATNNLAYLYDVGLGTARDEGKAVDLYQRAADLGWAEAMWNLANVYGSGQLGEKDSVTACGWTLRARSYAPPNDRRLVAYANRAAFSFQSSLGDEEWARCKRMSSDWTPGAATIAGPRSAPP